MMKKTGIELISIERQEQIEKHGFDNRHDSNEFHKNGELSDAAIYAITLNGYPEKWDKQFYKKIKRKDYRKRLIIAGALIAAEIDRLNHKLSESSYEGIQSDLLEKSKIPNFKFTPPPPPYPKSLTREDLCKCTSSSNCLINGKFICTTCNKPVM